jgi:hypothetical protein
MDHIHDLKLPNFDATTLNWKEQSSRAYWGRKNKKSRVENNGIIVRIGNRSLL